MESFVTCVRLSAVTLFVCVGGYILLILGFAQLFCPESANGSLVVRSDGVVVGSRLLAQGFTAPRYFWPRPSAVGWNAAGAGGSNKSPTNPDLTVRAKGTVAAFGATPTQPLPAELAAASGSGLDPHLTERGALYQVARVAAARGLPEAEIRELVLRCAFSPGGGLTHSRLVNVLEVNLALDGAR